MRFRHAFVILNPMAGRYDPKRVQEAMMKFLRSRGARMTFRVTLGEGDAAGYAKEALSLQADLLCIVGGDGTIREVFHVLTGRSDAPVVALIPAGSANVLVRALKIPTTVEKALHLLDASRPFAMDLGYLVGRDEHFSLMVTTGFHASVIRDTSRETKRRYGFFGYFVAMFRHLWHMQDAEASVTVDGRSYPVHSENILIANVNLLGFEPLRLAPEVRLDDGMLDVIVFEHASTFRFFRLLAHHLFTPLRPDPRVHFFRGRDIIVLFQKPVPVQVDGDPIDEIPLHVQAVPRAVRVLVPK